MKKPLDYFSYLLRLWREGDAASWRASLEDPHTGERRNFARLQDLFRVIEEATSAETDKGESRFVDEAGGKTHHGGHGEH